ncbi:MAG: YfiR family protein [candidate division Zixibacteria bacterium]|nr:YfiR family protein [candidate division Zixibacteria bacterium]
MLKKLAVCLVAIIVSTSCVNGQTDEASQFKADFIVKLVDYVTWPSGVPSSADGVVVGVVGETPLLPEIERMAADKTSSGTKVTVKSMSYEDNLGDANIVFMATTELPDLAKVLKGVAGKPVLTVADAEGFAGYGVMINFFLDDKAKVKFEANTLAAKDAGLKISSKLLKLAKLI